MHLIIWRWTIWVPMNLQRRLFEKSLPATFGLTEMPFWLEDWNCDLNWAFPWISSFNRRAPSSWLFLLTLCSFRSLSLVLGGGCPVKMLVAIPYHQGINMTTIRAWVKGEYHCKWRANQSQSKFTKYQGVGGPVVHQMWWYHTFRTLE